jgi:hypothetical protein
MTEMNRKSKLQTNQIEQMKEDVHAKERGLVAEQFERQSAEKRLEQKSHEVDQLKRLLDEANVNVTKQASVDCAVAFYTCFYAYMAC